MWLVITLSLFGPTDEDTLESLRALGYVDSAPTDNPEDLGVTALREGAYRGVNLISSRHSANAKLVDMTGQVLHEWKSKLKASWMHVEMQPNGDLVALAKDAHLTRLDDASNVLWRVRARVHHDFFVTRDRKVLAIARRVRKKNVRGATIPVLEDLLLWISPEGKVISEHSILDRVAHLVPQDRIRRIVAKVRAKVPAKKIARPEYEGDVTHTNSVRILRHDIQGVAPAGSVILSLRELNRVVILDASLEKLLWAWGEDKLEGQHHATQLDNGHIMVFDNGVVRKQSRVLEVDAASGRVVWEHTHPELFTRLRGAAQALPNGNVLITESDSGHALEVTRSHDVVWEFWNPEVRGGGKKARRDAIYRLSRYPESYSASLD